MRISKLSRFRVPMMLIALGCGPWPIGIGRFVVHAADEPEGYAWHQLNPLVSPGPRYLHGMAYDSHRSVHVLIGFRGESWDTDCATWEYNGADRSWTLRTTSGPGTTRVGIAFDAARNRTVLLGGYLHDGWRDARGNYFYQVRDTWLYDGQTGSWSKQVMPADRGPWEAYNTAIAYHGALEVVMILGGVAESVAPPYRVPDWGYGWAPLCYAWDGSSWSFWQAGQPAGHYHNSPHAMVYESGRQQMLTFDTLNRDKGEMVPVDQEAPPPLPPATWVYSRETPPTPPILYVDQARAVDPQDGTLNHPFRTVRQAVARATPGTIIGIAAGDYVETPITFSVPGLLDVSSAGGSVTIR